ncbi:TNF receptor-associated factor 1-like [Lytechinus pictus]|uniref:TNF receptor-associated factor 1-like n=1 Tax=Lytechinus pictus TaxID=7653 RepID=UPI0030B9C8F1
MGLHHCMSDATVWMTADDFETWDWTCGLVLRSDKTSVRDLIERLVTVFSAIDPKVPITLDNDEYAANQTSEPDCSSDSMSNGSNQSEIRSDDRKDVRPRQNECSGKTSPADECDGESLKTLSSVAFRSGASAATNGFLSGSSIGDLGSESKGFSGAVSEKDILRMIQTERKKSERDLERIKKDTMDALKISEPLKNMPKAFAAIADKQEVFESVLATFNKDVMRVHSRLDKLNLSPSLMNQGISEKLQKKSQELERALLSLRQDGTKVEERLLRFETSYSGVYLWPIPNYSERKRDAMNTNIKSIYSPPFFTSQYGYKLCGRVFLMGDGVGKGTHISLFLTIMRGPHDSVLPWPFKERITFQLVNQDDPINKSIVEAFRPDPASSSFKKPTTEKNIGAGCPLFAKIQMIEDPKSGFVRDNTIYLKIISQTSDVPEIK